MGRINAKQSEAKDILRMLSTFILINAVKNNYLFVFL